MYQGNNSRAPLSRPGSGSARVFPQNNQITQTLSQRAIQHSKTILGQSRSTEKHPQANCIVSQIPQPGTQFRYLAEVRRASASGSNILGENNRGSCSQMELTKGVSAKLASLASRQKHEQYLNQCAGPQDYSTVQNQTLQHNK